MCVCVCVCVVALHGERLEQTEIPWGSCVALERDGGSEICLNDP